MISCYLSLFLRVNRKDVEWQFRKHESISIRQSRILWSTLLEYLKMFRIDDIDHLKRYNRILDCPSGASSFVAEANNRYEINAVGCDPLFDKDVRILQKQGEEDIEYVLNRVSIAPELYNWDFYSSTEELRDYRKLALEQFISDYKLGRDRKRYVKAELPKLPFVLIWY